MLVFARTPTATDYLNISEYLVKAEPDQLHPALWPLRQQVAERLKRIAVTPEKQEFRQAYHALQLFVW